MGFKYITPVLHYSTPSTMFEDAAVELLVFLVTRSDFGRLHDKVLGHVQFRKDAVAPFICGDISLRRISLLVDRGREVKAKSFELDSSIDSFDQLS